MPGWYLKNADYERYIHSSAWREKADARLDLDRRICCVCGKEATEVHHLTYDRFGHEDMDDLVSLCHKCHMKAEELYDPALTPWAMDEVKPEGNTFMAAMRTDADRIATIVFDYIKQARGVDFNSMMQLRQPVDDGKRKYWSVLKNAVRALCKKRYSFNCVEDRCDLMMEGITNHLSVVCLSQIEHDIRNAVQADLHKAAEVEYMLFEKWKDVAVSLGISTGTLSTIRRDDGSSFGPTLREAVLYYCGLDAAAGIAPPDGFQCLTAEDYEYLNRQAEYVKKVTREEAT